MALSVAFATSQVLGASSEIVITDQTTGTDAAVVSRRVYLTDNKGLYYNEDNLLEKFLLQYQFQALTLFCIFPTP